MQIKAVPQTYAGVQFRSTLEADWAATFDARGIEWLYEPEAVELPSGTLYRPDFWLPGHDCWAEVKGPGVPGAEKAYELSRLAWVVICGPSRRGQPSWSLCDAPDHLGRAPWPAKREHLSEYLGEPPIFLGSAGWLLAKSQYRRDFVRAPR